MTDFEADPNARVAILTGAGRAFCAGADLKSDHMRQGGHLNMEDRGFCGLTQRVRTKPLICAVDGPAYGGGFAICLASDIVTAATGSTFALPEVHRGKIAVHGGLLRLGRSLPSMIAMEIGLAGQPITAERAHELGLVNRLTEPGKSLDAAIEIAENIVKSMPQAIWATKKIIDASAAGQSEKEVWDLSWDVFAVVRDSDDTREGTIAFNEGREPNWVGH
jgi:acetyl-CoA C-acetyltransferase